MVLLQNKAEHYYCGCQNIIFSWNLNLVMSFIDLFYVWEVYLLYYVTQKKQNLKNKVKLLNKTSKSSVIRSVGVNKTWLYLQQPALQIKVYLENGLHI
jgi:predicted ferric reductase